MYKGEREVDMRERDTRGVGERYKREREIDV